MKTIKSDKRYNNEFAFAHMVGYEKFKSWAVGRYGITEEDWIAFKDDHRIIGSSDVETITDYCEDQDGFFLVDYVDDGNLGYIRVIELED